MAETALDHSPLTPAIGPASPDDRRRARVAGSPPRRPSSAAGDTASETSSRLAFESIALLLQGGGALGAYQAGVYEALAERGLHPNWIAGISIGAVNGALIAGNAPDARVDKLRSFWERVLQHRPLDLPRQELRGPFEGLRLLACQYAGALGAGYYDTIRTLRHPEVLERPANHEGVFTFDLSQDGRE
jgi:hypothetical protein